MTKIGKIIELPKRLDRRSNLTVAEEMKDIPFNIARVYWVYDVPGARIVADTRTNIVANLLLLQTVLSLLHSTMAQKKNLSYSITLIKAYL